MFVLLSRCVYVFFSLPLSRSLSVFPSLLRKLKKALWLGAAFPVGSVPLPRIEDEEVGVQDDGWEPSILCEGCGWIVKEASLEASGNALLFSRFPHPFGGQARMVVGRPHLQRV